VATADELASGRASAPAPARGTGPLGTGGGDGVESFDSAAVKLRFDKSFRPRFKPGDRVVTRNFNPEHHTRLPRYARGKRGVIRYDQGVYTVAFEARELWGADANPRAPVYLDCWDDYLERDRAAAKPAARTRPTAKPARASRARKGRKR